MSIIKCQFIIPYIGIISTYHKLKSFQYTLLLQSVGWSDYKEMWWSVPWLEQEALVCVWLPVHVERMMQWSMLGLQLTVISRQWWALWCCADLSSGLNWRGNRSWGQTEDKSAGSTSVCPPHPHGTPSVGAANSSELFYNEEMGWL